MMTTDHTHHKLVTKCQQSVWMKRDGEMNRQQQTRVDPFILMNSA